MTTRDRIVEEALTLFSIQGYQGTSVKHIADKVGIKDSSLYKHFSSKKEIFDTIVQEMSARMEEMSRAFGLPDEGNLSEAAVLYGTFGIDKLLDLSKQIFLFYLRDEFASRFRRMLAIEQYRDRDIYEVYRSIFMNAAVTYQTALFGEMIQRGIFTGNDPEAMAVNFYAPIFFLLNKYDQEPQREAEALQALERQIREFARIYQGRESGG